MARVKVTSKLFETNYAAVRNLVPQFLKIAGDEGVKAIKGQTRSGYEMIQNGGKEPQPDLEKSTVKRREKLSRVNKTHQAFSPSFSNLTFTGQLLNAVEYITHLSKITFQVKDSQRKPYRNLNGSKAKGETPTNRRVAEELAKQGRFFIALDKATLEIINNKILRVLRRELKKLI